MAADAPSKGLDTGTRLAVDRTRLAHDRTLMAWVRTAASLISFGFTIYKFFEFELKNDAIAKGTLTPRQFGIIMIGAGLMALLLGAIEHSQSLKLMHREFGTPRRSMAGILGGVVAILGILAFVAALLRA